jgi:predicted PurR-regulated permease PerM
MLTLVNILVLFFIILIGYQIILANHIIEGLESYQPYDTNNPANALILAQQNAGNIEYIKQRLDSIQGLDQEVQDISGNVITLQDQLNQLLNTQQQYANQMTGGTPPNITGAVSDSSTTTQDTS